ncbi:MAG: metallophosphatase family protein [Anaerolineae bacterium]|nr:metallophosphatase family protein [Anaerolineae bacterium]
MKIAIFGDVHGNLQGLEAVLADIIKEDPDIIVCSGDLIVPWPDSLKCWDTVQGMDIPMVRGNQEEGMLTYHGPTPDPVIHSSVRFMPVQFAAKQFNQVHIHQMKELPLTRSIVGPNHQDILICHGMPTNTVKTFSLGIDDKITQELETVQETVIVAGHIHKRWHKHWNGKLLILTGSGGLPLDGQTETVDYLVLTFTKNAWEFTHKAVTYDHKGFIQRILDSDTLTKGGPIAWIMFDQLLTQQDTLTEFFTSYLPLYRDNKINDDDLQGWEQAAIDYLQSIGRWEIVKIFFQ